MTTITLSQSLFESDLSGLATPATIKESLTNIFADLQGDVSFNEEVPENGVLKNPTFSGLAGEYQTNGSVNFTTSTTKFNFKGATITTTSGEINVLGTFSGTGDSNDNRSSSQKLTSISYIGEDGNKWSVKGGYSWNYKYTASSDQSSNIYSESFQSVSATDTHKNSITFSGNVKSTYAEDDTKESTGYVTSISLNIAGQKLNATGLKLTYDDILAFELGNISDLLPQFLTGNDTLTVSTTDPVHEINGYAGNDKITGSAEEDTIIGGAGSDKLTGGKGTDSFVFSASDFYTENAEGNLVFNQSTDTITDFNLTQGDSLLFNEMGELQFYSTLADAKANSAALFYVKGAGKIYMNTDTTGEKYTPTVIIKLTGNPAVNADLTDWNYPA